MVFPSIWVCVWISSAFAAQVATNATVQSNVRGARAYGSVLRADGRPSGILKKTTQKHTLRICNAYASGEELTVYQANVKVTETTMPYKTCREFEGNLQDGDKINFEFGYVAAGAFMVSDLPAADAVMVVVVYRHDQMSSTISFESHVFSNLLNAQIAVLDMYRGERKSVAHIQDVDAAVFSRNEILRYNSVVAVNQGHYQVVFAEQSNESNVYAKQKLVALNKESYVVVRCGLEAIHGQSFVEDMIIFPKSDDKTLRAGAYQTSHVISWAVVVVILYICCSTPPASL